MEPGPPPPPMSPLVALSSPPLPSPAPSPPLAVPAAPPAPQVPLAPTLLSPGAHTLPSSSDGLLLTLSLATTDDTIWPQPVARSYDGHAWELVSPEGGKHHPMPLSCVGAPPRCVAIIPHGSSNYSMSVHSQYDATISNEQLAARWLMQTTFGPTRTTVNSLAEELKAESVEGAAFRQWIKQQMALPATLHREYWRKRTNPRPVQGGTTLGNTVSPCQEGTRWHPWTFSQSDIGKDIAISSSGLQLLPTVLSIDGTTRTAGDFGEELASSMQTLRVVDVEEQVGGSVTLFHTASGECGGRRPPPSCFVDLANPPIVLPTPDLSVTQILNTEDAVFENIT